MKSCAGVPLNAARVTPRGLERDRDFMLVDEDDDFVSQRKLPELAVVVPRLGERSITLSAPGMETIDVPYDIAPDDGRVVMATLHRREVAGQVVSEEANEWFSTFLPAYRGKGRYRLLRVREDAQRQVGERYRRPEASNAVGFADSSSMLLATPRSLAELNRQLAHPVPMDRFRPNIVVDGESLEPYAEDRWLRLRIGPLEAFVVKACDRCVIPDVDQATAQTGKQVRRALRLRRGVNAYDESNAGVFFAQNLNHVYVPGIVVRVGDPVLVCARSNEPNVRLLGGRGVRPPRELASPGA